MPRRTRSSKQKRLHVGESAEFLPHGDVFFLPSPMGFRRSITMHWHIQSNNHATRQGPQKNSKTKKNKPTPKPTDTATQESQEQTKQPKGHTIGMASGQGQSNTALNETPDSPPATSAEITKGQPHRHYEEPSSASNTIASWHGTAKLVVVAVKRGIET